MLTTQEQLIPKTYENSLYGKRAFVLGNGPSLGELDLSLLNGEWVIGTNRTPAQLASDYYVVLDGIFPQEYPDIMATAAKQGSRMLLRGGIGKDLPDWVSYHTYRYKQGVGFNPNPHTGLHTSSSVVIPAIQIAYWLGADPIIVLGVDLTNYTQTGGIVHWPETPVDKDKRARPAKYKRSINPSVWGQDGHPGYKAITESFKLAAKHAEKEGRTIVNGTPGGRLNSLPRVEYASLFQAERN